jgi:gamma-glutamyltranspeptidase/glutathione hydrolase
VKKCLFLLGSGPIFIGIALGMDMVLAGSVYHPFTYLYNSLSWLACKSSPLPKCGNTKLSTSLLPVLGKNGIVVTTQHRASEVGLQILQKVVMPWTQQWL